MSSTARTDATAEHLATVKAIYAAFGQSNVPAILERLAEDVHWEQWEDSFAQRADVPWLRPRTGREAVPEFFSIVGSSEISEFAVRDLMASRNQVVAEVVIDAALPDGGRYRDEELHLWTFNDEGKITSMRHYTDTAKHIAASRGEDTTKQ
jgi:ketosteroid isomerase-like protein